MSPKITCISIEGGLREISDAGCDNSATDEEDAEPSSPSSTPGEARPGIQTSLPSPTSLSRRLEDVLNSVQEASQVLVS